MTYILTTTDSNGSTQQQEIGSIETGVEACSGTNFAIIDESGSPQVAELEPDHRNLLVTLEDGRKICLQNFYQEFESPEDKISITLHPGSIANSTQLPANWQGLNEFRAIKLFNTGEIDFEGPIGERLRVDLPDETNPSFSGEISTATVSVAFAEADDNTATVTRQSVDTEAGEAIIDINALDEANTEEPATAITFSYLTTDDQREEVSITVQGTHNCPHTVPDLELSLGTPLRATSVEEKNLIPPENFVAGDEVKIPLVSADVTFDPATDFESLSAAAKPRQAAKSDSRVTATGTLSFTTYRNSAPVNFREEQPPASEPTYVYTTDLEGALIRYRITENSAKVTKIGSTGIPFGGIDMAPDGSLYGVVLSGSNIDLYRINLLTAATAFHGTLCQAVEAPTSLSFDKHGMGYLGFSTGAPSRAIYKFDPANIESGLSIWYDFEWGSPMGTFIFFDMIGYVSWKEGNRYYLKELSLDTDNQVISHQNIKALPKNAFNFSAERDGKILAVDNNAAGERSIFPLEIPKAPIKLAKPAPPVAKEIPWQNRVIMKGEQLTSDTCSKAIEGTYAEELPESYNTTENSGVATDTDSTYEEILNDEDGEISVKYASPPQEASDLVGYGQ